MAELAEAGSASWRDGETRDVHVEMSELTVRILSKTLFSTDLDGEASEIVQALGRSIPVLGRMPLPLAAVWERLPLPSARRFAQSVGRLDRASRDIIQRRRGEPDAPDDLLYRQSTTAASGPRRLRTSRSASTSRARPSRPPNARATEVGSSRERAISDTGSTRTPSSSSERPSPP